MTDTISKRIANMRWRRLAMALVGLLGWIGATLILITGMSSTPFAQAQLDTTSRYQVEFAAPGSELLPDQAKAAIVKAASIWTGEVPANDTFLLVNLEWYEGWALGTLTTASANPSDTPTMDSTTIDKVRVTPYNMIAFVLVETPSGWRAALDIDPAAQNLLPMIPDSELSAEAKRVIFPSNQLVRVQTLDGAQQQYKNYKFPWRAGEIWYRALGYDNAGCPGGWHNSSGTCGGNALDFYTPAGNSDILAAAPGTVTTVCKAGPQAYITIQTTGTTEKLIYVHIAADSVAVNQGSQVAQGQRLGNMAPASEGLPCGWGTFVHLHLVFPTKPFTIDGYTFPGPNNNHAGVALKSTNGVSPTAPADTNLIKNANFDEGGNHWARHGSHTGWAIYKSGENNFLAWKGEKGGTLAAIRQEVPNSVPPQSTMELRLRLGNSSNVTKVVRAHIVRYVGDGAGHNWKHMAVCDFSIPPQTPLQQYVVREYTTDTWEQIGVWIENKQMDSVPDILMDDVSVYRYPRLVLAKDECFAPSSNVNWNMAAPLGLQGWTLGRHLRDVKMTNSGGGVWMKVAGNDPYINGPELLNVEAAAYPVVHVRMASTSTECGRVHFRRSGLPKFSEAHGVDFKINPDGRGYDYFIDLSSHPSYVGSIAQIRLDPGGGSCGYNAGLDNALAISEIHLLRNNLVNTSFETAGAGPRFADKWTHNKPEADRRHCQDGIAHTGRCAYRFQPGTRPGQVVQRINGSDGRAGDIINVAGWVRTNKAYAGGGAIILQVDYTDGTKGRLRLAVPKSLAYTQISGQLALEKPVKNMRLIMQRAATMRGMFLADDVNVAIARLNRSTSNGMGSSPDDGGLVPLPAAPTEGQELRGN